MRSRPTGTGSRGHRPSAVAASLALVAGGIVVRGEELPPPEEERFQQDVAWSPDGRWIAYSEYDGGEDYDPTRWAVWVARVDGTDARRIATEAVWVTWSPDGDHLAYGTGPRGSRDIHRAAADGSGKAPLTDHPADDFIPAFSPDGRHLAFCSDRDGNVELYRLDLEDGSLLRLTDDPAADYNPVWSPDGREIAFFRESGDARDQIWVVAADGSSERPITREGHNVFPAYLRDGRIAFVASAGGDAPAAVVHVAPDGSDRVTREDLPGFFARWSPDGRRVAFIAGHWPRSAIYVRDADGATAKLVN